VLKTLEMGLGEAFTPEVKAAWVEVYGVVSSTMIGDNYKPAASAE
jgi:hemoglobin-like flavoprotein